MRTNSLNVISTHDLAPEAPLDIAPSHGDWVRRVTLWEPGNAPRVVRPSEIANTDGFPWFELACGPDHVTPALEVLSPHCPGLTDKMLEDLMTPDEEPEGKRYGDGGTRLACSFSVAAERPREKMERGKAQSIGALVFQPVELLASEDWLITCWHPRRIFTGLDRLEDLPPDQADALHRAVTARWQRNQEGSPADLGISIMHELALSYAPTHRALHAWLEDWELSLYTEDKQNSPDRLPALWGLMAVLRNWLNPLNKPGLRADLDKAWLPTTDHDAVIEVDDRVDKALAALGRLSETLRQSFGLLHLEQTEEQRRHSDHMQRRLEIVAVVFLVPTLIVGFYGANTWVPGQGRHWGFWVMVAALVILSVASLVAVVYFQRRSRKANQAATRERRQVQNDLLRGGS